MAVSAAIATMVLVSSGVDGQRMNRHELIRGDMPPGVAADLYRMSHPSLVNHVQPVRVIAPQDARVEIGTLDGFTKTDASQATAAMRIGPVYRFKVTHIPMNAGKEVYPSIEVLDRLTPPAGLETDFPIQIVITQDDLQQAIDGRLVTRVIYLEDPETALPHRHRPNQQPSFDIGGAQDPLRAAEGLGRPMAILRIGSRIPMPSDQPQSFNFYADSPERLPDPQSSIARARIQLDGTAANSRTHQNSAMGWRSSGQLPTPRRDELIFDGNDRGEKVTVDDSWNVYGLDTEDTIGHFDTLDGRRLVTPSNRVAIYAPRFGAVRKVDGVFKAQFNQPVGSVEEKTPIAFSHRSEISSTTKQHLALQRNQGASRASGFNDRTRGVTADGIIHLFGFRNTFEPYENLSLIRLGTPSSAESARLSIGMLSAGVWQDNLGLQVVTKKAKPIIVKDVATLEAFVSVKTEDGAILRVTKVASRITARTDEEVEFTIRFDNLSSERIGNVTLIDNLTRRLEYIPGSSECSLKADFISQQNDGGSLMLRWEITDPIEPLKGGIIRFKCRVR